MKINELMQCSFQNWYKDFKKITPKSIFFPLPKEFVSYLLEDGIILPKSDAQLSPSSISSGNEDEETWENETHEVPEAPYFPDVDKNINDAIEKLGGKVFPKLNWSSTCDASWIALNNTCCCTNVSEVYLLLKSSDFIAADLTKGFGFCEDSPNYTNRILSSSVPDIDYYLILRKWMEIDPSGEFRCFVKNQSLIAITQREHSLYFEYIESQRESIINDIISFFNEHIKFKFPLPNYTFDVYRKKKDSLYLIDFNPFGQITNALLFDWDELLEASAPLGDDNLPELRYVYLNHGVQPRPQSYHALSQDILDISSGEDSFKLVDLIKMKLEEQNGERFSDEDPDVT